MARACLVAPLFALVLGACASPTATSAPPAQPEASMGMPTPGPEHKQLLEGVGSWEGTATMFQPGMPTTPIPAKESVEAIGGFWTQSKFSFDVMPGMTYLGTGCMGYDQREHKYVGTWIDNFTSGMALMSGEMSKDGKTLVMRWQAPDPTTGKLAPERNETVFSKDSYTSTFYRGEGAGTKVMVIQMKRVGGAAR